MRMKTSRSPEPRRSDPSVVDPITLSEQNGIRYLHFGSEWIQGAMRIKKPFELEIDYTRDMMAWQPHVESPEHIVQLGLGAASLTKYCYKNYPSARITAVEINPRVVVCARQFFKLPGNDERLSVLLQDAGAWVSDIDNRASCDVLQIDLYDAQARGPVYDSLDFYQQCRKTLRRGGAMTVNVFGNGWGFEDSFAAVFEAFDGGCEAMDPVGAGNRIILAFA
jgi:spermidine synthase